ncbi:hypothetical protein MC7420_782 [Coleofasciculus chthonoplastes PCC 7420]|uniref:Uncharacterized protein n=1 Tax=Coleofasciculus chthonoplastes PCC 7420 TaxID=118168 RepID=B4VSW1_9CYAN|nr:hypothetical protein MC7420_782 [Coleofasciculus chthonoplastes PCC 7420]
MDSFTGFGKPLSKPLSYKERGFEFSPFRPPLAPPPVPLFDPPSVPL